MEIDVKPLTSLTNTLIDYVINIWIDLTSVMYNFIDSCVMSVYIDVHGTIIFIVIQKHKTL